MHVYLQTYNVQHMLVLLCATLNMPSHGTIKHTGTAQHEPNLSTPSATVTLGLTRNGLCCCATLHAPFPLHASSDQEQQTRHVIEVPRVLNVPSAGQGLMVAVRAIGKQEACIYMLNAINMT